MHDLKKNFDEEKEKVVNSINALGAKIANTPLIEADVLFYKTMETSIFRDVELKSIFQLWTEYFSADCAAKLESFAHKLGFSKKKRTKSRNFLPAQVLESAIAPTNTSYSLFGFFCLKI